MKNNKHYIVLALFAMCLATACQSKSEDRDGQSNDSLSATISVQDSSKSETAFNSNWRKAYLDYLNADSIQRKLKDYPNWGLVYIDNDDIPELLFLGDCNATGDMILTYYNGRVSHYDCQLGVDFIPKMGLILNEHHHMAGYWGEFIRLENGEFNRYLSHVEEEQEDFSEDVEDGVVSIKVEEYTTLNDETVDDNIWKWEKIWFESLPHSNYDKGGNIKIKTYPTNMLLKELGKKK